MGISQLDLAAPSPWSGVRLARHVPIPMRDGTRLRADLYLPAEGTGPWPVVVEYLPYRKDDLTAPRWNVPVALAQHGIVGVRVDVRGTGSSGGIARDEYSEEELQDGEDVLAWLAAQPWCSGRVGLWGTSYGAFNALQIAMRRPPHLTAIVAHAGSDDRYATDVHYWGGCVQAMEFLSYPLWMVALNALPPDPEPDDTRWLETWRQRVEQVEPWLFTWLHHQRQDDYWLQGSLATDYKAITCPVFVVGAWHDGYTDAALRMLERLSAPVRGLIGPWTHERPDASPVGPRIDFFGELLAWWRRWLLNQSDDTAPIRFYLQEAYRPQRYPTMIPGRWYAVEHWPPTGVHMTSWFATTEGKLALSPASGDTWLTVTNDVRVGLSGSSWCPTAPPDHLAADQRLDDLFAVTFDSDPLPESLTILGFPELCAVVAAEVPVAFLCVRLSHLWEDGQATLITRGVLNLTRRHGLQRVEPLRPSELARVRVPLKACCYRIPAGHRLRLALSGADFPTLWPAPYRQGPHVRVGGKALELRLPLLRDHSVLRSVTLPEPQPLPVTAVTWSSPPYLEHCFDLLRGRVGIRRSTEEVIRPVGRESLVTDLSTIELWADLDRPSRCQAYGQQVYRIEWPVGVAETRADVSMQSTSQHFHLTVELVATWNGHTVTERRWAESIARDAL